MINTKKPVYCIDPIAAADVDFWPVILDGIQLATIVKYVIGIWLRTRFVPTLQ